MIKYLFSRHYGNQGGSNCGEAQANELFGGLEDKDDSEDNDHQEIYENIDHSIDISRKRSRHWTCATFPTWAGVNTGQMKQYKEDDAGSKAQNAGIMKIQHEA